MFDRDGFDEALAAVAAEDRSTWSARALLDRVVELCSLKQQLDAEVLRLEGEVLSPLDGTCNGEAGTTQDADASENDEEANRPVATGRTNRIQDAQLRSAIERHAVEAAIDHYAKVGATEIVTLGKPYDIRLFLADEARHIEVKGSSLSIDTVELTVNEVNHAQFHQPTDLVVVDCIEWSRADGEVTTSGGRLRVWSDWTPRSDDLSPRKFEYLLPVA